MRILMLDVATGDERDITPPAVNTIQGLAVARDSGHLFLSYEVDRPDREPDPIYGRAWDTCLAEITPGTRALDMFYCSENVYLSSLTVMDSSSGIFATESYFEFARIVRISRNGTVSVPDNFCCIRARFSGRGLMPSAIRSSHFSPNQFQGQESMAFTFSTPTIGATVPRGWS